VRQELEASGKSQKEIQEELKQLPNPSRRYSEFRYQTLESWKRERRVIAKAEHLQDGPNPRFVLTSIPANKADPRTLYESGYCGRGDMENRIKETQLYLFADRTSAETIRANQLRLWFSCVAYTLLVLLRRFGLRGAEHERARCGTIRIKLLKIGAQVVVSVRRVLLRLASGYPLKELFLTALNNIRRAPVCLRC